MRSLQLNKIIVKSSLIKKDESFLLKKESAVLTSKNYLEFK